MLNKFEIVEIYRNVGTKPQNERYSKCFGCASEALRFVAVAFLLSYFKKYLDLHDIQKKRCICARVCVNVCVYIYPTDIYILCGTNSLKTS